MADQYKVTTIDGGTIIPAAHAREAWDLTPETQRRGQRDGAFMLFELDDLGRSIPTVYQPINEPAPEGNVQ